MNRSHKNFSTTSRKLKKYTEIYVLKPFFNEFIYVFHEKYKGIIHLLVLIFRISKFDYEKKLNIYNVLLT